MSGNEKRPWSLNPTDQEVRPWRHPATLATAKHGGCVQLAASEGQAVLTTLVANWRGYADKHELNALEADSIGDMTATVQELETKCEVLRQVAGELEAALSAQPSLGGQGDALRARELLIDEYRKDGNPFGEMLAIGDARALDVDRYALRAITAALSAQPSPGGQGDARIPFETWAKDGGFDVSKFKGIYNSLETRAAWEAWLHWQRLSARQPVCATVKNSLTVGGGQTVGEPVMFINSAHLADVRIIPMVESMDEPNKMVPRNMAGINVRDEYHDMPLYAAPPAQAVDLGQFRDSVMIHRMHALVRYKDTNDEGHKAVADDCDRLLTLIDSRT